MKVSVIIPVYNVDQYLRHCLESVVFQSYSNKEIILINDGSTDCSQEICEEYVRRYPFIRLINKENEGLSEARNVGILHATGDYVMFLDSDDYWQTDFLSDLVEIIHQNNKVEYIFFPYQYYYQQRKIYVKAPLSIERSELIGKNGVECLNYILKHNGDFKWFAWSGIVKKSFLLKHELFFMKGRKYEDALWTPYLFLKATCIDYYDNPIYVYRNERIGQITLNHSYSTLEDSMFVATYWHKVLTTLSIEESLVEKLMNNFVERYYYSMKFACFLKRDERKKIISLLKKNRALLQYKFTLFHSFAAMCSKTFGFHRTIQMIHIILTLKGKSKYGFWGKDNGDAEGGQSKETNGAKSISKHHA